jgi:carboxymethylenebutenolidase
MGPCRTTHPERRQQRIPVGDGSISAYRARPAGKAAVPVLLVGSEIFGVHAHIQDPCHRLAHAGFPATAPDLFERQGRRHSPGQRATPMG